ncbi:MAG: CDP-alcohol phosphatidyltransferase family protein [candidate division WOR-3 bacterium]|nr:MAG: CDP-alcohol phosphatidyltransferase family protein [candidate division WOR-3 bacterium]
MPDRADHRNSLLGAARLVTVPNLLSLSRLVLLPVVLLLLARNQDIAALAVMAVSWITDGLDGFLARRLHQVTDLGRVLDHLVDKIWTGAVLVTLVYLRDLPLLIAAAVILRDLLILTGSLVIMRSRGSFVSSDVLGKITGFAFALLVVYYTLQLSALQGYKTYVDYTIGILIVVSFLNYVAVFLKRMGRFRLPADENGRQHPDR